MHLSPGQVRPQPGRSRGPDPALSSPTPAPGFSGPGQWAPAPISSPSRASREPCRERGLSQEEAAATRLPQDKPLGSEPGPFYPATPCLATPRRALCFARWVLTWCPCHGLVSLRCCAAWWFWSENVGE